MGETKHFKDMSHQELVETIHKFNPHIFQGQMSLNDMLFDEILFRFDRLTAERDDDQFVVEIADEELKIVTRKELKEWEQSAIEFDGIMPWIVKGKIIKS